MYNIVSSTKYYMCLEWSKTIFFNKKGHKLILGPFEARKIIDAAFVRSCRNDIIIRQKIYSWRWRTTRFGHGKQQENRKTNLLYLRPSPTFRVHAHASNEKLGPRLIFQRSIAPSSII